MDEQRGQRKSGRDQGGRGSQSIGRPVTPDTPPSVKACALSCQR
ncbi:uncharacterized, partial [Tachysurus ichikawai]